MFGKQDAKKGFVPSQMELVRLALLESHGRPTPGAEAIRRHELNLTRLNLACGILVLGLTAIARVL